MSKEKSRATLFRHRGHGAAAPVTNIELFFDLVFVFAVTQLSHRLLEHLSIMGAVETLVLFLAVWWLWVCTCWTTNWLNPDRGPVRAMLMVMMLGTLVMASVLPDAFGRWGVPFAISYVVLQGGRTLFMIAACWGVHHGRARNFMRIAFYILLAAPLCIAGGFADPQSRLWFWIAGLAIEYTGPYLMFRTPFLGRSTTDDWDISGTHMAERCGLFIIIALGEAVLVTGATVAGLPPSVPTNTAFAASFIGSAAMWWIYFDTGAERAGAVIEREDADAGRIARNAYTYLHMPIVAGVIVTAVGDELILSHPIGHTDLAFVLTACGGPLLFLIGTAVFKWATVRNVIPPFSHLLGIILLIAIGTVGLHHHWNPLTIGVATTGALVFTAIWEWFSLHGGMERWTPRLAARLIALTGRDR